MRLHGLHLRFHFAEALCVVILHLLHLRFELRKLGVAGLRGKITHAKAGDACY